MLCSSLNNYSTHYVPVVCLPFFLSSMVWGMALVVWPDVLGQDAHVPFTIGLWGRGLETSQTVELPGVWSVMWYVVSWTERCCFYERLWHICQIVSIILISFYILKITVEDNALGCDYIVSEPAVGWWMGSVFEHPCHALTEGYIRSRSLQLVLLARDGGMCIKCWGCQT